MCGGGGGGGGAFAPLCLHHVFVHLAGGMTYKQGQVTRSSPYPCQGEGERVRGCV